MHSLDYNITHHTDTPRPPVPLWHPRQKLSPETACVTTPPHNATAVPAPETARPPWLWDQLDLWPSRPRCGQYVSCCLCGQQGGAK
jgi:hypothetical protein